MDEVAHDTEVLYLARGIEIVDVAGIDTRIFTLPREISNCTGYRFEKSAEVIVPRETSGDC